MLNKSFLTIWGFLLIPFVVVNGAMGEFNPKIWLKEKGDGSVWDMVYFDDSTTILTVLDKKMIISYDDGGSWHDIEESKGLDSLFLDTDPYFKDRVIAYSRGGGINLVTHDKGKTWKKFSLKDSKGNLMDNIHRKPRTHYNTVKKDYILIETERCTKAKGCRVTVFYTDDLFNTEVKRLRSDLAKCKFAKASLEFAGGDAETMYCSENKRNSFGHVVKSRFLVSKDFFKTYNEIGHDIIRSRAIHGLRIESTFMIVSVDKDKYRGSSSRALLVSKDGQNFREAELNIDISYGMVEILKASALGLLMQVVDFSPSFWGASTSQIYMSDSSGLNYKLVLSNVVDILEIQTAEGSWIANIQDEAPGPNSAEQLKSVISIDNGHTWKPLKVLDDPNCKIENECSFHVIDPVERTGGGNFSTGPTPGIMVATGSLGKYINFDDPKTYYSRDGGLTWRFAIDKPSVFSFGDLGNAIVAVQIPMNDSQLKSDREIYYSLDQGKSWSSEVIHYEGYPWFLTTNTDGSTAKFIFATNNFAKDGSGSHQIFGFDFSDAFGGQKCGKNDYEEVYSKVDEDGKPECIFGHKEKFLRRKQDAQCFRSKIYEDIIIRDEKCTCLEFDFECAEGFKPSDKGLCVPNKDIMKNICSKSKSKNIKLPDKRLVEGTLCTFDEKKQKDFVADVNINCAEYVDNGDASQDYIRSKAHKFESQLEQYLYVEENDVRGGDTVLVKTQNNRVYVSNNGGTTFQKAPFYDPIVKIVTYKKQVALLTNSDVFYLSMDGGFSYKTVKPPSSSPPMLPVETSTHPLFPWTFLYLGSRNCGMNPTSQCQPILYFTEDGGERFSEIAQDVFRCTFAGSTLSSDQNLIFCLRNSKQGNRYELVASTDYFKSSKVIFDSVVGYAYVGKFIVVAVANVETKSLEAKVSEDGVTFADAKFPHELHVDPEAYTILGGSSGSIFMHITTNPVKNHEVGSILKSNSNGTSYVMTLQDANRNTQGYVDFDRIEGIEGILMSNIVQNPQSSEKKSLRTVISHNDGAEWSYLNPPKKDSKGKKYPCLGKSLEKCSLNLHGFTERPDYRDTYSSPSAPGMMFGVGNVGRELDKKDQATFLTTDGGITWKEVRKGVYMWEFGDRGTILSLVDAEKETDKILYSLDNGNTWKEYQFTNDPVRVLDLATVPSDTSRKFLIFTQKPGDRTTTSFSIDFSKVHHRQCNLDLDNPGDDDYVFWTPKHPDSSSNCLFGHEAKYLRRAKGRNDCFIGAAPLKDGIKVIRNCTCTRSDYECDYNYFRDTDGTCQLVHGLSPADHKKDQCKNDKDFQYFEPTGYRKVPLSTCVGGKNFDKWNPRPCPGKLKEFKKHYNKHISGFSFFLLFVIPLSVFVFATWFVYDKGVRRNGGFKQIGQIRLDTDEDDFQPVENNNIDKVVNKVVRAGIYVTAIGIAGIRTIAKIDKAVASKVFSSIFRRNPGERSYVHIPDFEEEGLFGDDASYDDDPNQISTFYHDDIEGDTAREYPEEPAGDEGTDSRLFDIEDPSDEELTSSRVETNDSSKADAKKSTGEHEHEEI